MISYRRVGLSVVICLVVYVLFLLTAATLLLLYPEDPESWLIEAGVLVAGSVLVAHVFSCESFGSGGGLFAQVLSRALPIVPLGKSASLRRSSLFLHVSAHSLASGQGSCVTGCIAGDLGGVHSRVYLHPFLAFPSKNYGGCESCILPCIESAISATDFQVTMELLIH